MALINFSDILKKAGFDPGKVKLIRHSLTDSNFRNCYMAGKVFEYTCHQKRNFSKGYDYWATFISGSGTLARFHSIYRVGDSRPDTEDIIPEGIPDSEASHFKGNDAFYDLERLDVLSEFEGKLTIEWGNSARMWHQKGTTEKAVVSIQPNEKKVFSGFENLVLSFDELKEIVDNPEVYDSWRTALSSVYAIYLIVDSETGRQYVGSAYGKDGLWGRWSVYVGSHHGNNKEMKQLVCSYTERYHSFQFSILQILPKTVTDRDVTDIESLWKSKLLSRKFGMNDN